MNNFFVYVKSQYNSNDTVRVTVVIEEGYNKQDVIDAVCELFKNESSFELHNAKVAEDVFSVNVKASYIELINDVDGVKVAEISGKVDLTDENQSDLTLELEKKDETVTEDYTSYYVLGGIVFVAVLFLGIKKLFKH